MLKKLEDIAGDLLLRAADEHNIQAAGYDDFDDRYVNAYNLVIQAISILEGE